MFYLPWGGGGMAGGNVGGAAFLDAGAWFDSAGDGASCSLRSRCTEGGCLGGTMSPLPLPTQPNVNASCPGSNRQSGTFVACPVVTPE
jgi:hypothetical protein